eukprot:XP_011674166.1 PREDICTED: DNA-directed RNA polymerase I subunit RPA43 [Strongylocentrotus purpuratus]
MDHVSCLVHNWFNLSLPLRGADAEERLPKGSKVMAKVTKIQAKNGILAIQGTPTEDRFSDLPLVDPLKEELSDDEGADTTEMVSETPRKVKHDSGFMSDPENNEELPLESTSQNDGENVGKEEREAEDELMEGDVLGMTEGESREGKKKKKKRKDEMMENEMIDSLGKISIKKEAEWSPDDSCNDDAGDGLIGEQTTEKKKKKKRKSAIESDPPTQESSRVKTEVASAEESIQDANRSSKKKKKKHKERDSEGLDDHGVKEEVQSSGEIRIKDEPESDAEQTSEKKVKRKKHKQEDHVSETDGVSEEQSGKQKQLKRKYSDLLPRVNGGGDHMF